MDSLLVPLQKYWHETSLREKDACHRLDAVQRRQKELRDENVLMYVHIDRGTYWQWIDEQMNPENGEEQYFLPIADVYEEHIKLQEEVARLARTIAIVRKALRNIEDARGKIANAEEYLQMADDVC